MPDKFEKNSPARAGGFCESRIDALVEELAAAPAIACGADFADRTIAAAKSACAREALNLRDDYAKITEMTREISDLSAFIVQEDFFNAIQPPSR